MDRQTTRNEPQRARAPALDQGLRLGDLSPQDRAGLRPAPTDALFTRAPVAYTRAAEAPDEDGARTMTRFIKLDDGEIINADIIGRLRPTEDERDWEVLGRDGKRLGFVSARKALALVEPDDEDEDDEGEEDEAEEDDEVEA